MLHGVNKIDIYLDVCQPNVQTNGQVDVGNGNAEKRSKRGQKKGSVLDIVYSPPRFLRRYKRWFR
jgi:hypothetical protein